MTGVVVALAACGSGSSAGSAAPVRARYALPASASSSDAERVAQRMEDRFRALGVSDVDVTVRGDTLVVHGPAGVTGLAARVGEQGVLEFRPVAAAYAGVEQSLAPTATPGTTLLRSRDGTTYAVAPAAITGGVTTAKAMYQPGGSGYVVNLRFDRESQRKFDALARRSIDRPPPQNSVALVIDDVVQSAPSFQATAFPDGVQISSDFTKREAEALAAALRSGAYPVPVRLLPDG